MNLILSPKLDRLLAGVAWLLRVAGSGAPVLRVGILKMYQQHPSPPTQSTVYFVVASSPLGFVTVRGRMLNLINHVASKM